MALAQSSPNPDDKAAGKLGIIEVNDLIYKLESDLSVAINRTHKSHFFQNNAYDSTQTAICILNSGADYIDPRRSFLSLTFAPQVTTALSADSTSPAYYPLISMYFGPTGSVLNFIDSVTVSTRSGDELSRINDFGQLMSTTIPWQYGADWRDTVGQNIGLGSYIGGVNSNGVQSTMIRRQFQIPLYLLSPLFAYGRLLPAMLMSGLRIEIRWKSIEKACQQFWENTPKFIPAGSLIGNPAAANATSLQIVDTPFPHEEDLTFQMAPLHNGMHPTFGLDPVMTTSSTMTIDPSGSITLGTASDITSVLPAKGVFPARRYLLPQADSILVGNASNSDIIEVSVDSVGNTNTYRNFTQASIRTVGTNPTVLTFTAANAFGASGILPARITRPAIKNETVRAFGAPYRSGMFTTGTQPLTGYSFINPVFNLCSIQLTDAVQRHLNEYSSVNGLEIVYADWDRTSSPVEGASVSVYQEVRKSASRALQVFAIVTDNSANPQYRAPFASIPGGIWNHYQFQLGSLYFPQQRVQDNTADGLIRHDNMLTMCYAYAADAFDRWHPKAAPTMMSLRGNGGPHLDYNTLRSRSLPEYQENNPDTYLYPSEDSLHGKWGSYANGALVVATTLERSTMFDLSGIPINNSRVLAIRGELNLEANHTVGMLFVFLKYVRLARVFLINVEVEQ